MKQIQYEGNHFRGVYHAKKDQILCVTIPYSKGWEKQQSMEIAQRFIRQTGCLWGS